MTIRNIIAIGALAAMLTAGCASRPGESGAGSPKTPAPSTNLAEKAAPSALPTSVATSPATAPSTWVSGMPPGQEALDAAIGKVEPMVEQDYADWFTSFAVQQPTGPADGTPYAVLVYRLPHPELDAAIRKAIPDTKVIFIDSRYSEKQCKALQNSVSFGYWKDRGLQINLVGPDRYGLVTIGVHDPAKWRAALEAEYGKDRIVVVQQDPAIAVDGAAPATTPK